MALLFYLDEDAMRNSLLRALRTRHADVFSAFEAGMISRSDEEHLEFAARSARVLFSFNVAHFCRIHREWLASGKSHAGIMLAQQRGHAVGAQLRGLLRLSAQNSASDMKSRLEFLGDWV